MNRASLLAAWRRLGRELADQPRLRLGIWAIVLLGLFYLLLLQSERLAEAQARLLRQTATLAEAEQLRAQTQWPALQTAEADRRTALIERFWTAETEGLAQARLQAVLRVMLEDAGMQSVRIQSGVSQEVGAGAELWQVQVQVQARYRPGDELRLLHALARYPRKLVVDRLDLLPRNQRMFMLISAYFSGLPTPDADTDADAGG